jgi:hypothetical protein
MRRGELKKGIRFVFSTKTRDQTKSTSGFKKFHSSDIRKSIVVWWDQSLHDLKCFDKHNAKDYDNGCCVFRVHVTFAQLCS